MNHSVMYWKNAKTKNQKQHFLLPSPSIRALLIGPSGCGKTSLLLKLLLENNWLDYKNLHIFSKSSHQAEYKILKTGFEKVFNKSDIVKFFNDSGKINVDEFIKKLPSKGKENI